MAGFSEIETMTKCRDFFFLMSNELAHLVVRNVPLLE